MDLHVCLFIDHCCVSVHMAAARLGCKKAMVGTGWDTSCSDCKNRLILSPFGGFISGSEGCLVCECAVGKQES